MMTCISAQSAMSALLDGELDAREQADVEAHARECEACARTLATLQTTRHLVRSAAPDWSQVRPSQLSLALTASMAAAVAVPLVLLVMVGLDIGPNPLLPLPSVVDRRAPALNLPSIPVHSDALSARDCRVSSVGSDCAAVVEPVACESIDECGPPPAVADFP